MSIFICPTCGEKAAVKRPCTTPTCDVYLTEVEHAVAVRRDGESEDSFSARKAHIEALQLDLRHEVEDYESPLVKFARVWGT